MITYRSELYINQPPLVNGIITIYRSFQITCSHMPSHVTMCLAIRLIPEAPAQNSRFNHYHIDRQEPLSAFLLCSRDPRQRQAQAAFCQEREQLRGLEGRSDQSVGSVGISWDSTLPALGSGSL